MPGANTGLHFVQRTAVKPDLCTTTLLLRLRVGKLKGVYLFPDPDFFGHGAIRILRRALATVPVVMTALICQYNV